MAAIMTHVEKDPDAVACSAFELVKVTANEAISKNGRFVLALAGGNTPKQLYVLLKNHVTDWHKWFLVYGDERCLPLNHPERNSTMVKNTWLDAVNFPVDNHFIIPAETGTLNGASTYGKTIAHLLPIDLALLGIGEDGHTASLFPANMNTDNNTNHTCIAVNNAPKPPAERISLSYQTLNDAVMICFMATGESKSMVLKDWQNNALLPFNRVHGKEKTILLADTTACTKA